MTRPLEVSSNDADDGCRFDAHTAVALVTWEKHLFADVRLVVSLGENSLQVDAAHGVPIHPAPIDVLADDVAGNRCAVRPRDDARVKGAWPRRVWSRPVKTK